MKEKKFNLVELVNRGSQDAIHQESYFNSSEPNNFAKQTKRKHEHKAENVDVAYADKQVELKKLRDEMLYALKSLNIIECFKIYSLMLDEAKTFHKREILKAALKYFGCLRLRRAFEIKHPDLEGLSGGGYSLIILSVLLLVESMLNSYFIGQGSTWGILGGAIEAFFIALLSIVLAYSSGVGVRALLDTGDWRRYFAPALILTSVVGLVIYHLLVGHYRGSLLYGIPKTAVADALANFRRYGTALPDLYCYSLVVVGLFFASTAFREGLRSRLERLRAEYRRLIKREEAAETNWRQEEKNYLGSVNQTCREQMATLDQCVNEAQDLVRLLRLNIIETNHLKRHREADMNTVHYDYITSLEVYWRAYEYVKTSPGPTGYRVDPPPLEIAKPTIASESGDEVDDLATRLDECLAKIEEEACDAKDKILAANKAALGQAPRFFDILAAEARDPSGITGETYSQNEKATPEGEESDENQTFFEINEPSIADGIKIGSVDKQPLKTGIWSVLSDLPARDDNGSRSGEVA
jgi:hypothetical protein